MLCGEKHPQFLANLSRGFSKFAIFVADLSSEEALQLVAPLLQALLQTLLAAALDVLELLAAGDGLRGTRELGERLERGDL